MRKSACLAITSSMALLAAAAQSAPLPNLVLACPDASALGQPGLDSCGGYTYEIPTNQRIVSTGSFSSNYWLTASDLGGSNTVLVCTLPVEPGTYSSCRDALGVRRTAYVPKDSVLAGGGHVTVSKTGGDYSDPVTAAENAFAGDTWCVAPQWPLQPCVMDIGKGVFILNKTLRIPEGLVVAGALKGDTLLVADIGVVTAVSSRGNARISDLTIVNSQPGGAQAVGLVASPACPGQSICDWVAGLALQVHDVAIHVSGVAKTAAVLHGEGIWVDVVDSEMTAAGPDSIGIDNSGGLEPNDLTLERSHLSANTALDVTGNGPGGGFTARFIDSHVFGTVAFDPERSLLEIVRSDIVGDVKAVNNHVSVVIRDSSIKGNVNANAVLTGADAIVITNTSVDGNLAAGYIRPPKPIVFDTLRVHGNFVLEQITAAVQRSYIVSSATAQPALSLGDFASVELDQTFVQGAVDRASPNSRPSGLSALSSVLAGPVSVPASCTDTYGADYELLDASCQPPSP